MSGLLVGLQKSFLPGGGGGGPSGPVGEWIPMTSAMWVGSVTSLGSNIIGVSTAWTISGTNASCNVSTSTTADGVQEGYCIAVPVAVLFAALDITEDDIRNGVVDLVVGIRSRLFAGDDVIAGVGLFESSDSSGNAATLSGAGGGIQYYDVAGADTKCYPVTFDASDQKSFTSQEHDAGAMLVRLGGADTRMRAHAYQQLDAQDYTSGPHADNPSGAYVNTDPLWLVLFAGCSFGALTADIDLDIWFAVIAGVNAEAVPT